MCKKLFYLAFVFIFSSQSAGQTSATIEEINSDLSSWDGQHVEVTGTWIADDSGVRLWFDRAVAGRTTRLAWSYSLDLDDMGGFPADPLSLHNAVVTVEGYVASTAYDAGLGGTVDLGQIQVTGYSVIVPPALSALSTIESIVPSIKVANSDCNECHFVLIICGAKKSDFWNDVMMKYDYKHDTREVCPENIVVLYGDGTHNPADIPNGNTGADDAFISGGVFPCNRANVTRAFEYIKQKMNDNDCEDPEFQFHSTGHGNGYQTQANQDNLCPIAEGYAGGRLDMDHDEPAEDRINENDIRFKAGGSFDIDGDGTNDILVGRTTGGLLVAWQDLDNDGVIEPGTDRYIGGDQNGDGVIDNNDGDWQGPDLNNDGDTDDDFAFDEVLDLGNGEGLVDDELQDLIEDLQNDSNLKKENTRAELAQCFSGGFHHDLSEVCEETTSAAGEGEFSYSKRGNEGYNRYQRGFMEGLEDPNNQDDWREAHRDGVEFVNQEEQDLEDLGTPFNETPEYQNNLVVDDFESYASDYESEENMIWETWIDGLEDPTNGSIVGNEAFLAETQIIHSGRQSMPFYYNNTEGATESVVYRIWDEPQDWSEYESLSLWVHGDPNNTGGGQFFVKINDQKVYIEVDLTKPEWQKVTIDLESLDVDIKNIVSLAIGIDGEEASGIIHVDDIVLYKTE